MPLCWIVPRDAVGFLAANFPIIGTIKKRGLMLHPTNPRDWYGLGRWKTRAKAHMRQHPLCAHCLEKGLVVPAKIADHIEPHRGDWIGL